MVILKLIPSQINIGDLALILKFKYENKALKEPVTLFSANDTSSTHEHSVTEFDSMIM
jgi:hypothetical protein